MSDIDFELRLSSQLNDYAAAGVRPIDRHAIAEATIAAGGRPSRSRWMPWHRRQVMLPMLLGLLLLGLVAGTLVLSSQLLQRSSVVPPVPSPEPSAIVVPSPSAVVAPSPAVQAGLPIAAAPCAAMLQIMQTWGMDEPAAGIPAGPSPGTRRNGDLLVTGLNDRGGVWVDRIDPSLDPPSPLREEEPTGPLPYAPGFPLSPTGRISPSPDGRAVAVEEGDLGQAGCGEPLVLMSAGGIRRPFPVTAFQTVTDLAWAPDGSALYGVRRPTVDAAGLPFYDPDTTEVLDGPGTVLRWDAATGAVTDLGAPCGPCGPLFVSPDRGRVATSDADRILVMEPDGEWRIVGTGGQLLGWFDDATLVTHGARMALDGTIVNAWDDPCCHGTGYAGLLSPDGTTVAGKTLSSDFLSWRVTLVDVGTGEPRVVWGAPDTRGCTAFGDGSTGRAECDATSSLAPGATVDPAISISGYSRVVAWAPDGTAVVLLDQSAGSTTASLRIVQVDGSGASAPLLISVPDLSGTLGFPNIGPSVAWMPVR